MLPKHITSRCSMSVCPSGSYLWIQLAKALLCTESLYRRVDYFGCDSHGWTKGEKVGYQANGSTDQAKNIPLPAYIRE